MGIRGNRVIYLLAVVLAGASFSPPALSIDEVPKIDPLPGGTSSPTGGPTTQLPGCGANCDIKLPPTVQRPPTEVLATGAQPTAGGGTGGSGPHWMADVAPAICVTTAEVDDGPICTTVSAADMDRAMADALTSDDEWKKGALILFSAYHQKGLELLFPGGATFDQKLQLIESMREHEARFFQLMTQWTLAMAQATPQEAAHLYRMALANTAEVQALRAATQAEARAEAERLERQVRSDPGGDRVQFHCGDACGQLINIGIGGWGGL